MLIGEVLVATGAVSEADVLRALQRQKEQGGLMGDNLVAIGALSKEQLERALGATPPAPKEMADTGLNEQFVLNLLLKTMNIRALETPSELSGAIKLPVNIVSQLLEFAKDSRLAEVKGSAGLSLVSELRYGLTLLGRERAVEAMARSQYLGPAPVSLEAYCAQIEQQHLSNERVSEHRLREKLSHLVLPAQLIAETGPAANSARAMLLYGPPGSGKTSIADGIGKAFQGVVFIPYAIEVDGQIITVFDPTVHQPLRPKITLDPNQPAPKSIMRENYDQRWVPCKRPFVIAGGELTLEMLDLGYNPDSGVYEAPLQIKSMNGIFVIDDFGRQLVNPRDLLNRWIVPLEKRYDFLHLATGRKFLVPFDVLIVFSTNMPPEKLMDEAFLRRIPYKIYVGAPSQEDYREIFRRVCAGQGVAIPDRFIDRVLADLYKKNGEGIASYHPKFLIDRVIDRCRFEGVKPALDWDRLCAAWLNLFVEKSEGEPSRSWPKTAATHSKLSSAE